MKKTKRIILVLMTILLMVIGTTIVSASTTYVYNKGDWKVRLDSPNTDGKTYWHLHFYQKSNGKRNGTQKGSKCRKNI